MHSIMFRSRNHLQVLGIGTLHPGNECHSHAASQERIFAVSFLPASPAWVSKNVDVGSPEGEPKEHLMLVVTHGLVVLGPRLRRDRLRHGVHEIGIPCRRHSDYLRKVGRVTGKGHAMQTLVPPVILWDIQPRKDRKST